MNPSSNNISGNKTNIPPHFLLLQAHHRSDFLYLVNKKKNHTTLSLSSKSQSSVCLIMLLAPFSRSQVSLRDCRASKVISATQLGTP
jgi:hypothetical protein